MYDELVKRLRNCATQAAPCKTCDLAEDGSCSDTLMKQAADAIEEMSRQLAEYHSYDGFLLMHGCFVDLPKPPKEE